VTSCVLLVSKGKGRILVYAVCDLAIPERVVKPSMVSTDLYFQTEPNPDCCESHLLQNKTLIRLWAPNIMSHPTASHNVITRAG